MNGYSVIDFSGEDRHGYIAGSRLPPDDPGYSPNLDIGFNRQQTTWKDEEPHIHTGSEEYFIVVNGELKINAGGDDLLLKPYHLLGIPPGISHQVIGGRAPIESLMIRVPGNMDDKVLSQPTSHRESRRKVTHLDLREPHASYQVSTSLAPGSIGYSPFFDFTSVVDADPSEEWKGEQLHYHDHRAEFYLLLKGELNFQLEKEKLKLLQHQLLIVRPQTPHKVCGGTGLVTMLFIRVPGGRGDKITTEHSSN